MKPCKEHFLGTNDIGQDIFSEIVYGTRYSLLIGFLAAMLSWLIGSVVGIVSGWFGGTVDDILMKITTFDHNPIFSACHCTFCIHERKFVYDSVCAWHYLLAGNGKSFSFTDNEN